MSQPEQISNLVFCKLGGSLITDKAHPRSLRPEVLDRLAGEIAQAFERLPGLKLLLGHGSGSFGHVPAEMYNTRQGVTTPEEWRGFAEVWKEAAVLNRYVMSALHRQGLPAVALPASASLVAQNRQVDRWDLTPLRQALHRGLLPVIYGDVVFDQAIGGTIFSTEDLFVVLAEYFRPKTIYLAGIEPGVWSDFPACTRLIPRITPGSLPETSAGLKGAQASDVTGGMASKVIEMVRLVEKIPDLQVHIFSGEQTGHVFRALCGEALGTMICAG